MNTRLIGLISCLGLLVCLSHPLLADIPETPCPDTSSPGGTLYVAPGGGGETLADVAATISVTIYDLGGNPIQSYPFQDIWPGSVIPGDLNVCSGGAAADANTDALGRTTISGTIAGGGHTQGVRVFLAGVPATCDPPLDININSPDITGDLVVDLADVAALTEALATQTDVFRADYFDDGQINLADVGIFSQFIGDSCP